MKFCLLSMLLLLGITARCQEMNMSDETTELSFDTRHLIGKLEGTARGINATLVLDSTGANVSSLRFSFASSTLLHNGFYIGPDLTKSNCFDVFKNPTVDLVSSSITKLPLPNLYQFKGALIIKGKSRDVTFPITAVPNVGGYDLRFQFEILKKQFDLSCAFHKRMTVKVKGYAKRKLSD